MSKVPLIKQEQDLVPQMADSNASSKPNSNVNDSAKTNPGKSASETTFKGLGNIIKVLPTGTVFVFQFINPVFTNTGSCSTLNKYLDAIFICLCGLSCFLASFTDSYTGKDGKIHYGIVTQNGLWPSPSASENIDLSSYKQRLDDFVHALFAVIVFAGLSLMDSNTVRCFYPDFETTKSKQVLLQALPPVIGTISSSVFLLFPHKRHGIGYPPSGNSSQVTPQNSKVGQAEESA